jgi:hypothetical protein
LRGGVNLLSLKCPVHAGTSDLSSPWQSRWLPSLEQPFDWSLRPIGEPWQFTCDLRDLEDLWGEIGPRRLWFDDFWDPVAFADSLQDYFGRLGQVIDATVDPQRHSAILLRLLREPTPPRAGPAAKLAA